jgi:hypothetical protein
MKLEYGYIIVGVAMVIFYLRMAQLRGRHRRLAREEQLARLEEYQKNKKRKDRTLPPLQDKSRPSYDVASWWLVGLGGVLMLVGLAMKTSNLFPAQYVTYWWGPVTAGVLVFIYSFK